MSAMLLGACGPPCAATCNAGRRWRADVVSLLPAASPDRAHLDRVEAFYVSGAVRASEVREAAAGTKCPAISG